MRKLTLNLENVVLHVQLSEMPEIDLILAAYAPENWHQELLDMLCAHTDKKTAAEFLELYKALFQAEATKEAAGRNGWHWLMQVFRNAVLEKDIDIVLKIVFLINMLANKATADEFSVLCKALSQEIPLRFPAADNSQDSFSFSRKDTVGNAFWWMICSLSDFADHKNTDISLKIISLINTLVYKATASDFSRLCKVLFHTMKMFGNDWSMILIAFSRAAFSKNNNIIIALKIMSLLNALVDKASAADFLELLQGFSLGILLQGDYSVLYDMIRILSVDVTPNQNPTYFALTLSIVNFLRKFLKRDYMINRYFLNTCAHFLKIHNGNKEIKKHFAYFYFGHMLRIHKSVSVEIKAVLFEHIRDYLTMLSTRKSRAEFQVMCDPSTPLGRLIDEHSSSVLSYLFAQFETTRGFANRLLSEMPANVAVPIIKLKAG